jgi:hypothetical protein
MGLVLVAAGGYFLTEKLLTKKTLSPWDLVPESSVFVYESNDCSECVEKLQQTSLWSVLRKAAFYGKPADSMTVIFDFLDINKSGKLVSTHITRKDDFDFVFYIPVRAETPGSLLPDTWKKLHPAEREFNSTKIYELNIKGQIFSWAQIENIWVGSFTPFLLEDVVRTYTSEKKSSFRKKIASAYQLSPVKSDAGNLYVHIKNFGQWLTSFAKESPDFIRYMGQSSLLDIKSTDDNIVLNGFSLDSANQRYLLSIFTNQVPVPFNLKNAVSDRSVIFMSYGISNGTEFGKGLQAFSAQKKPRLRDSLQYLNSIAGISLEKLYASLGKEVGVCLLESRNEKLSRILLVETTQPEEWITAFNTLSRKTSIDTIFVERFSEYEIREVPVYAFPEKLFWPLVSGFPSCFYTRMGNTLIMGENLEDLKQFLDDIDKEDTWGKSVAQNKFLETTLLEANMSIYINTPLAWNIITHSLHPKWQKFIRENRPSLEALGMGAIQLSHLNNSYYTNVTWNFGEETGTKTRTPEKSNKSLTSFNQGIHKFFVVRNQATKRDDVFIQDSTNAVSLIANDGKVLWRVPVEGPIAGDVTQIDYFNNGKLQLFFATPGALHVIDRLGNYVKPFPVAITEKEPELVSIIDYDHSKKYRFLVSGKSGKLWMYDKEGNSLEGWQPKNVGGKLFTAPQHHRIRGKDYLIALREDGIAYLMSRRGETLKKFPLDLDARLSGDYFLESGNSAASTFFVVVSRDGFRIKFNLDGKVHNRETLIKSSPEASFRLIREEKGKSYIIVKQEARHFTLLDENLKEIVVSDFIGNNPTDVHFYDFGSGKAYITVTDKSQDLSFVYDLQGNLLTTLPVESNAIIVRPSRSEKPTAYLMLGKTLTIQPL